MPAYWILKTEPSAYSFDRLLKDGKTVWDGVTNPVALRHLRIAYPKVRMPSGLIDVYAKPPDSPDECIFAQTTTCVSADFQRRIEPCQFGGTPDCSNCGCIASAGLAAVGRHRLPGGLRVGAIFERSLDFGRKVQRMREHARS